MKLTKEDEESCAGEGPLIVERSLRPKKEQGSVEIKNQKETTRVRQAEMTEDSSVVSAYQEGGGGEGESSKEFERKMLMRRQEAEKKTMMNKSNKDTSIDSLVQGVKDCSIDKDKEEEDELSGQLSNLSLKRQEPREDDERGDDGAQTEEEVKDKNVVHDQRWATLEEPSPDEEQTNEDTDDTKKKKAVQKRGPMGGVAVYSDRVSTNNNNNTVNGFSHQQMALNGPNSLALHHQQQQQLQQQQQALAMPHNFPNYQDFQQSQVDSYHQHHHHAKRGFDLEIQQDTMHHCTGEAAKYIRPQQMPQNNLDAPGMPLSPTSFNKPVSTVCTKQMAGATLLQQNSAPVPGPMMSPTHQQQQQQQPLPPHHHHEHQVWSNAADYQLHQQQQQLHQQQQSLLQQNHHHHHHNQQQQQQQNFQQGFIPDYPSSTTTATSTAGANINDLESDLTFLDEVIDDDRAFERMLDTALAVHKGQDDATILQKDLEPILTMANGFPLQPSPYYMANGASSPPAANGRNTTSTSSKIISQHRNSQEDTGYITDQSPTHDSSQYSPGPHSVMEASPAASSGIGTSPPPHHNNWSPPPSNLSEMSQDSGVCSPMSEDGKLNYGQIKSPRSVPRPMTENNFLPEVASPTQQNGTKEPLKGRGYIVPPVQDPMSRLAGVVAGVEDVGGMDNGDGDAGGDEGSDLLYHNSYVDSHLEDLNDAVSVLADDVQKTLYKQVQQLSQTPSPPPVEQQQLQQQQQQQPQNRFVYHHLQQQQQQQQQQKKNKIGPQPVGMGFVGQQQQVQQTTNVANGSGGVMVNNCPPPHPPLLLPAPPQQLQAGAVTAAASSSVVIPPQSTTTIPIPIPVSMAGVPLVASHPIMIPNNNNMMIGGSSNKMMPSVGTIQPTTTNSLNQQQQPSSSSTALVFTSSSTAPTVTPPPNANGKLPIPATPRRAQSASQSQAPMIPAVGFPNNGQMTALIIIPPQKPRFPNIAPKDPTRQNGDAAANGSNTGAANTNNNNRTSNNNNTASLGNNGSPPRMHHHQPQMVANGNNNIIVNGNAQQINGNAQQINGNAQQINGGNAQQINGNNAQQINGNAQPNNGNKITRRLNCARRTVAQLVREDLEFADADGDSYLHVAVCRTDDPYLIQALLERMLRENLISMINAQNNEGQTPLYLAVSSNDPGKVKVIVDKGADVNLYAENRGSNGAREQMAAIHCASSQGQGYLTTLKALLTAPGIQVDLKDSQGHTALHCAILCHGKDKGDNQKINSLPVIETLVAAGANLNLQVRNGRTALMFAMESGHMDLIEKLFSLVEPENRQQCLRTQDVKGNTVLKIAERVKALLTPVEQQRLHNCLKRSVYQRNGGLPSSSSSGPPPVVNGVMGGGN